VKTAEVDHRVPLFRVWREHRRHAMAVMLGFWASGRRRLVQFNQSRATRGEK